MKEPKSFLYALKILFKDKDGKIFGPSQKYEYELGKWHVDEDNPSVCCRGFHVPTWFDISGYEENTTWLDYYKQELEDQQYTLADYVVKLAGKFSLADDDDDEHLDKLSASKIFICEEISEDYNKISDKDVLKFAKWLKKKHKNCIYKKSWKKLLEIKKGFYRVKRK